MNIDYTPFSKSLSVKILNKPQYIKLHKENKNQCKLFYKNLKRLKQTNALFLEIMGSDSHLDEWDKELAQSVWG
jgi:hypothetical protein